MPHRQILARVLFRSKTGMLTHEEIVRGNHSQIARYTNSHNAAYTTSSEWGEVVAAPELLKINLAEVQFLDNEVVAAPDERTRITMVQEDGRTVGLIVPDLEHHSFLEFTSSVQYKALLKPKNKVDAQNLIDYLGSIFTGLPNGED